MGNRALIHIESPLRGSPISLYVEWFGGMDVVMCIHAYAVAKLSETDREDPDLVTAQMLCAYMDGYPLSKVRAVNEFDLAYITKADARGRSHPAFFNGRYTFQTGLMRPIRSLIPDDFKEKFHRTAKEILDPVWLKDAYPLDDDRYEALLGELDRTMETLTGGQDDDQR